MRAEGAPEKKRFLSLYKWISKSILGSKTKTRAEGAPEKKRAFYHSGRQFSKVFKLQNARLKKTLFEALQ